MNIREQIAKANAVRPSIIERTVVVNGVTINAKFRRLSYMELEKQRLYAIGANGTLDKNLHAGAGARAVASMLCDDSGQAIYTVDDLTGPEWDDLVIKALADECADINKSKPGAVEAEAKNSDATSAADPS